MIKEVEKGDEIYIWNNHYQGTFTATAFEELLETNELIKKEVWEGGISQIKSAINSDLFQKFAQKYNSHQLNQTVKELESFVKEGKEYLRLNLCLNAEHSGFMACFLLDQDYTVQYLCIDSKIEVTRLTYIELNQVYNKHKELIPPPLDFIEEFNRMNTELSELTGENVDRTMYQVWFKLLPNIRLEPTFAKAYNAYQNVGDVLFGDSREGEQSDGFEYVP